MTITTGARPAGRRRTLTLDGRLPGVDCRPALPAEADRIRMDVAAFVGFAERGPCDQPVVVEDIHQYRAVFGGDVLLATDDGAPVYAHLPTAVAAFFDNGGRRCQVVRATGPGRATARWTLPGLVLRRPDGVLEDVMVDAAWPGRWAEGHQLVTTLLSTTLATGATYVRSQAGGPGTLRLRRSSRLLVQPADLLRLDLGPLHPGLYVVVTAVSTASPTDPDGPRDVVVSTSTEVAFHLTGAAADAADTDAGLPGAAAELLLGPDELLALPAVVGVQAAWRHELEIVVQHDVAGRTELVERWSALGLDPASTRPWTTVLQPPPPADPRAVWPAPDLGRSTVLRLPAGLLRDDGTLDGVFLPVGTELATAAAGPGVDPSGESPEVHGRDGLDAFDPVAMFLDPALAAVGPAALETTVDALTSLAASPWQLRGLHALAGMPGVDLIALPDVVHRPWSPPLPLAPTPAVVPPVPPVTDWSSFRRCAPDPAPADPPPPPPSASPSPLATAPRYDDPADYDAGPMVEVQARLAELCAAYADRVAVLSVPRHFDVEAVQGWRDLLADQTLEEQAGRVVSTPLSYAAYWHPWVQLPEPTTPQVQPLRAQPPDGAVTGMVAARGYQRGVWVAPANVALRGPVALTPRLDGDRLVDLFDAHANLVTMTPGGPVVRSAHTLTDDRQLLQLSVHRLLILLRKIVLLEGNRYVFEVNTDRFRALVRSRFERLLDALTTQGALAAYEVVTDGGVNTAEDLAQGRLVVVIRIAPTQPTEFITVTLRRSGEGLLDVAVG